MTEQASQTNLVENFKTHVKEMTPAERLAAHDAAAIAHNTNLPPAPKTKTEEEVKTEEKRKNITFEEIVGACYATACHAIAAGQDLLKIEAPDFLLLVEVDCGLRDPEKKPEPKPEVSETPNPEAKEETKEDPKSKSPGSKLTPAGPAPTNRPAAKKAAKKTANQSK